MGAFSGTLRHISILVTACGSILLNVPTSLSVSDVASMTTSQAEAPEPWKTYRDPRIPILANAADSAFHPEILSIRGKTQLPGASTEPSSTGTPMTSIGNSTGGESSRKFTAKGSPFGLLSGDIRAGELLARMANGEAEPADSRTHGTSKLAVASQASVPDREDPGIKGLETSSEKPASVTGGAQILPSRSIGSALDGGPTHFGFVTLSTAPGDGQLIVDLGAYGDFGFQLLPEAVAPPGRGDALYDPLGPSGLSSTTWESSLQLRHGDIFQGFITTGLIAPTGWGGRLPDPGFLSFDNSSATSAFTVGGLHFLLEQRVSDLITDGKRTGGVLTQTYTISNLLDFDTSFEIIRYYEGDLRLGAGAGVPDGGGHLLLGSTEIVFQTDRAGTPATTVDFVGITAEGGSFAGAGRYEVGIWPAFPNRIATSEPLGNVVFRDGPDEDEFVDLGLDYDVGIALANQFINLATGQSVIYETRTLFGSLAPASVEFDAPPVAVCQAPALFTEFGTCTANAVVDAGSFAPEGGDLIFVQEPPGPYSPVETPVTLTVNQPGGRTATCDSAVTVHDPEPPRIDCNAAALLADPSGMPLTFTPLIEDNCQAEFGVTVEVTDATCFDDDSDDDGVTDEQDDCLDSDLAEEVVIGECSTGVVNVLAESGCTITDRVLACADTTRNHGQFVSCVAHLTNELKGLGVISGREKGEIQRCVAQAQIPEGKLGSVKSRLTTCSVEVDNGTVSFPQPPNSGLLQWTVTASDGSGNTTSQDCTVVIQDPDTPLPNLPPTTDAGDDRVVQTGVEVTLDGSGSTDLNADPITYQWTLTAVPTGSLAVLSDPTAVQPTLVPDLSGVYTAQLAVNDGQADSAPDAVKVVALNRQPMASAGPDRTAFLGDTVTLDGAGSMDPEGRPLTYTWTLAFVPEGSLAVLDDPTSVTPSFEADIRGPYVAQLTVRDGELSSLVDAVIVRVVNRVPVADAGPAQEISVFDTVTLDGSGSVDGDGDPITYAWSLTSKPAGSTAALDDATSVTPSFFADLAGTYVLELVVNDGFDESAPDAVSIVTVNTPPVTSAGPDQTAFPGDTVQLDGTGSFDVDGDVLTYQWTILNRPAGSTATLSDATSPQPTFVVDARGNYDFQLVVSDGQRSSRQPDTVRVTVPNRPPIADAGTDQNVFVTDTVFLDGSGSFDPDGEPLSYVWSFLSVPPGSTAALSDPAVVNPTFVVDAPGTYVVELMVSDGFDSSAPDTVTITTLNSPPVADAGPDQEALPGDTVQLDGSGSFDIDGDALNYSWSFLAVPPGSSAVLSDPTAVNPTFVLDVAGAYLVQLVVNDGRVDSAPDTVSIATGNVAPVADAGPDQTVFVGDTVQLDGSGSFDANGDSLTYLWSFVSVPDGSLSTLSNPSAVNPTFEVDVFGTYVVQLVVNDGEFDSDPDTVTITTENSRPVADARADNRLVPPGTTVFLDGSTSSDADGDPLTFFWSFLTLPEGSTATLSNPTAVDPLFVADIEGAYVVQLIVNDGELDSEPDTVMIEATDNVVTVPHVVGEERTAAEAAILAVGLSLGPFSLTSSDTVPVGYVISQAPPPGSIVLAGAPVLLIVSTGPAANRSPEIISVPPPTATEGVTYFYPALATDPEGDALTWSLVEAPTGATISESGLVQLTPRAGSAGTAIVTLRVEDAVGNLDQQSFELSIREGTGAPSITSVPPLTATRGVLYSYLPTVSDPDDLTFQWSGLGPSGLSVDATTGQVLWSVPAGASGSFEVRLTVTDPTGLSDTQKFSIGVGGDGVAPTVSIVAPADGADLKEKVEVVGTVTDPALAGFRLEACRPRRSNTCTLLTEGLVPVNNGVLGALDPKTVSDGSWELRVTARDADGNVATGSVDVEIHTLSGKIGAVRLAFPEFTVRTSTATLTLTRVYDGLDRTRGELGNGWRYDWAFGRMDLPDPMQTGWERRNVGGFIPLFAVVPTRTHPLTFTLEDGRFFEFNCTIDSPGTLASINECTPRCTELTGNGATLTVLDGATSTYGTFLCSDSGGTLIDIDRDFIEYEPSHYRLQTSFGEQFTFSEQRTTVDILRDTNGLSLDLTAGSSVALNGTELIRFTRSGDLIERAENVLTGDVVTYDHDGMGDLVRAVTILGEDQTFEYAPGSRLIHYQVEGLQPELWEYDDESRVIRQFTSTGAVIETEYDDDARRIIKRDLGGREITTEYDAQGRVIGIIDPLGNETTYTYVGDEQQESSVTDPLGNTTEYEYDNRNRKTLIRNGEGEETRFEYSDLDGRPLVVTDGEGRVWKETQDSAGRVTARILPDGTVAKTYTYRGNNTRAETDVFGTTTIRFDYRGRMIESVDGLGRVTAAVYDDVNKTATYNEADGSTTIGALDPLGRFTSLDFGETGSFAYVYPPGRGTLPEMTVRPDGSIQEIRRDSLGRPTQFTVDGETVRELRYDALGQLASVQEGGKVRTFSYDGAGRRNKITSAEGTIEITYDAAGRATFLRDDSGQVTHYEFDGADRPIAVGDGNGQDLNIAYDQSGRISHVIDPLGRSMVMGYDDNGRLLRVTHFGGQSIRWTYLPTDEEDEEASLASLTDTDGLTWSFGYDPDRNLNQVTDPLGGVTAYEYTTQARLTRVEDALNRPTVLTQSDAGVTAKTTPEGRTDTWQYDGLGRLSEWRRADGSRVTYSYVGETTTVSLPSGDTHTVTRDLEGRLVTSTGTDAGTFVEETNFRGQTLLTVLEDGSKVETEYSQAGKIRRIVATSPGGVVFETRYEYDSSGRLVALTAPDGGRITYTYDDASRLTRIERPNGVTTVLTYLSLDRPIRIAHSRGGQLLQSQLFDYDTEGRLVRETRSGGTFEFEYDGLSRLRVVREIGVGETTHEYDAVGNLIQKTLPGGDVVTCSYDDDDRLLSCSGPEGVTSYTYNGRGALTLTSSPSGNTAYQYDDLDRLVRVTTPGGDDIRYQYDVQGHLVGRDDGTGLRRCVRLGVTPRGFDDCALSYSTSSPESPTAYIFGPDGIASVQSASTSHLLTGLLGSVTATTDAGGNLVAEESYNPWRIPGETLPDELGGYGYTGERQDPITGLVYLRQRWYDPATGRFLTPDNETAEGRDPRSLHRYLYALANPVNNTDPDGGFSIGEISVVESIQNTLQQIRSVAVYCIKETAKAEIFQAVGEWAANRASSLLWGPIATALEGLGPNPLERPFHNVLFDFLCQDQVVSDMAEFEVRVSTCGERISRQSGRAALIDCLDKFRTNSGIDIVLWGSIPIEVKRTSGTAGSAQLKRYCRFGANEGTHVTLYVFWRLPSDSTNRDAAEECWECWSGSGCAGKVPVGSIYGAVGILANNEGKHTYVPDLNICKKK